MATSTNCNKCGRPMVYAKENKCNYCDSCMSEYCGCKLGRIKEIEPTCDSTAVIPSITVQSVEGITNLANCLVHVEDINTTFYVDDKHRIMITWAGPVDIPGYDMETNPNKYKDQIVTDVENETAVIYDKHGKGYLFGITPDNLQTAINNKLDEMAADGTLGDIIAEYIGEPIFGFDTVADMKASTTLKAGDRARTLGFYSVNDGGGALYKITNTGTANEMDIIGIGNLNAHLIYQDKLNVKQIGAFGDDSNDDTTVLQYALDTIKNNSYPLYIPKGIYKITTPLHLEYGSAQTPTRPSLFKMYGDGGSVIETGGGTILKGYNIASGNAVLEIVGNGNTWGARCRFEDFVIIQDSSCDSNSFCFKLGDTFHSMLENIKMLGYNDLLLKCGTTSTSWGNICLRFTSCVFNIIESYNKGFAILPERVLLGSGQPSDCLLFESCDFHGLVVIDCANATFNSCMESVTYKTSTTENVGDLNGIEVNYGSAYLVIGAKNIEFNNCYFEDFINGIEILPLYTSINNVIVDNCYFNSITNMTSGGNIVLSNSAVYSRVNSNHTDWHNNMLTVSNTTFRSKSSSTDYGFVTAEIINDNSEYLNVTNYTNLNKDTTLITVNDTASKYRKNEKYDYSPTTFTVTKDTLSNYGNIFKFEGLADKVPFTRKFRIKKIEIFFSKGNTATGFSVNLKDKDDTTFVTLTHNDFTASADKKYYCSNSLLTTNYTYPATIPNEFYVQMYSTTMSEMIGEAAKIVIQLDM